MGAVDYVTKPISGVVVKARIKTQLALFYQNRELEKRVDEKTKELNETRLEIIKKLGRAAEYKDNETGMHVERMSRYCHIIALDLGFSEKDAEYRKGIQKIVTAYDAKKTKIMVEVHATPISSEREGWDKTVTYYWGGTSIGEVYSTDSHSETYGFDRMVNYYDKNGVLYEREYYLRKESVVARLGVYKRVIYYDENGRETESKDLDRLGNLIEITLEEYKRIQKSKDR